jgi:ribosome maturation factor RimP
MKSKILSELLEATGIKQNAKETDADLKKRVVTAVTELTDAEWAALSSGAQDWFNQAADAINAKEEAPDFPDAEDDEPAVPARRRGAAAEKKEEPETQDPQVGDMVKIVTKRGKETEGELVEIDEDVVVLDVDGTEEEFDRSRIDTITVLGDTGTAEQSSDDAPAEPKVGDNLKVVTKRGKEVVGELVEIDGDILVIKTDDEEVEVDSTTAQSVEVVEEEKPAASSGRRRGAPAEPTDKPAAAEKTKRTTAADNGGVVATVRMRELIVENMDLDKAGIAKLLGKEKITYKDNTLDLVYADSHKLIKMMKDRKLLK